MIPRRRKKARMGVRQEERVRSPGHLQFVRGHECAAGTGRLSRLLTGETERTICSGRIQSHHVRVEGEGTTGKKPPDSAVVPLCAHHHTEGHRIGWKTFERIYQRNLTADAADLWRTSPHGIKWRREHDGD